MTLFIPQIQTHPTYSKYTAVAGDIDIPYVAPQLPLRLTMPTRPIMTSAPLVQVDSLFQGGGVSSPQTNPSAETTPISFATVLISLRFIQINHLDESCAQAGVDPLQMPLAIVDFLGNSWRSNREIHRCGFPGFSGGCTRDPGSEAPSEFDAWMVLGRFARQRFLKIFRICRSNPQTMAGGGSSFLDTMESYKLSCFGMFWYILQYVFWAQALESECSNHLSNTSVVQRLVSKISR